MFLFNTIRQKASVILYIVLLGLINSVFSLAMLGVINSTITQKPLLVFPEYKGIVFAIAIVVSAMLNIFFQTKLIKITNTLLLEFEISILQKLRRSTYESFQKLGHEKVYTAIGDARVLGELPQIFTHSIISMITVICGLGYLFYISWIGGLGVTVTMIMLLAIYLYRNKIIVKDLNKVRDLQNDYHKYLTDLLRGFREIKMSSLRNDNIYSDYLKKNREEGTNLKINTSRKYLNNELLGNYSWYIIFGLVIFFVNPIFGQNLEHTSIILLSILYLMGPITSLVTLMPTFSNIKIAVERLNKFDNDLDSSITYEEGFHKKTKIENFNNIKFKDVEYVYFDTDKQESFTFGPQNLEIFKGEVTFITGSNGSGKSTFVNLITGLYKPSKGDILFNDRKIENENYQFFINHISSIFSNHHIFSENYDDFDLRSSNSELQNYICDLMMENIINLDNNKKYLDYNLSKGQQKRLALIYALLEDRPILVLDEWAAEQDPEFREYFYTTLLPKMKNFGKTIILITHDDRYFSYADKVIQFNYRKIKSTV